MVGSSLYNFLKKKNFKIIDCKRKDLDFTKQSQVEKFFKKKRPNIVINAAGKVGGILDNKTYQSDYIFINSMIGLNIINSSLKYNVKKLINLGSACIYPKKTNQPIKESALLSSQLEETNEGYALAKILSLKYSQHLKKRYKKEFISLMPANLYGRGDNFDLKSSHVLPALVKKFIIAKTNNIPQAEIFPKDHRPWGWFESLAFGDDFQVKRIFVKPGALISLQSHKYRSEHWIVIMGIAQVTIDDDVKVISRGQSVYIPVGAVHRMENLGTTPMILIEVQVGSYIGEDDIVRYEDVYARN